MPALLRAPKMFPKVGRASRLPRRLRLESLQLGDKALAGQASRLTCFGSKGFA